MNVIHDAYSGLKLKEYRTEITARQAMNYAAAIGDNNPFYFDDEQPGGALAPPMLAVALTWPVSANLWDYLPGPDFPTQLLLTQVHYSERLEFHQPLRPGTKLAVRGQIAAITPHRSGTLVALRYDAQEAGGAPVFSEYIGGLLRGVACEGPGRGGEALPATPEPPQGSETLWEESIWIDPLASYIYDGCADVHFPIHTSAQFARQVGLPGIILQGTATLAHAARQIVDRHAAGDPARLKTLACRFGGLALPGSEIRIRLLAERSTGVEMKKKTEAIV